MTLRLDSTLRRLEQPLAQNQIRRVEVARDGRLVLTVLCDQGVRWFADHEGELQELVPAEDETLSLAQRLRRGTLGDPAHVLAWRPGRRMTVRAGHGASTRIHKGWRNGRGEPAVRRHSLLEANCTRPNSFRVPRVLSWSGPDASLTLEHIEGHTPSIQPGGREVFFRVGRALREMHGSVPVDDLNLHGWAEELAAVDASAARARSVTRLPDGWEQARERLDDERLQPLFEETARTKVATHRDLHDDQLLNCGDRVGLLDLDLFCASHPLLDLANLAAHIDWRALQGRKGATTRGAVSCSHALVEGFGLDPGPTTQRALAMLQASTWLRLAPLYTMRPRWWHLAPELVLRAEDCLDGALS